jgi:hypothetical protein
VKRDGRFKTRAVVKGFHMVQGEDFNETFAPVPGVPVIRILFCIAAKNDWEIKQGDVGTAFLAPDMDTELYVNVPNYFCENPEAALPGSTIRRLLKGVPGIPQGPRLWHKKSHAVYTKQGLVQCKAEPCLYYCVMRHLYLIVWVDDLFVMFPKEAMPHGKELWAGLQAELELPDWEDVDDCLSCIVTRDRPNRKLSLSQRPAMLKLLEKTDMLDCSPEATPMASNLSLTKVDCPTEAEAVTMTELQRWFRSVAASMIYFCTWTRPDLSYAVSKLCKFMHNPGQVHVTALKRVLRYIKGTVNKGLVFDFGNNKQVKTGVYGYYDASHADDIDTRKSTLAYVFFFEGCPITWHTKLHSLVTTSTNHSEYCAAAKAGREAKWLETLFSSLGLETFVHPIDLFSDSKGSIAMTYNPVQRAASKHVDLADHYARELQELGIITITYVNTKEMIADLLTKALGRPAFEHLAGELINTI